VNRFGRRLDRFSSVRPWVVLATLGCLLSGVAVWHYWNEIRAIGVGVGPVVAGAMSVALSTAVVYAALRLRESGRSALEGWLVVGCGVGGGLLTGAAYGATLVVRYAEGRPLVEPLFPLIVVGTIGVLAGVVIGEEYVSTRRLTERARESRDAMAFTNSLLRHDVRNALQIVDGHASVLADHEDGAVRESAETIAGQAESLERIVTEVESVVTVLTDDAGGEPVDVSGVVADAVESTVADRADVSFDTDLGGEWPVEGGEALYPVFSNLLGNAVEHAEDGGVYLRVTGRREGDSAVVRVADDGPGIPESERDRVFERGVSTDGGGHGLYVAETVVERLGGDIYVEESDLGGAAFVVEVPLVEDPDADSGPFGDSDPFES
jgi:signal transduction histidine kinase